MLINIATFRQPAHVTGLLAFVLLSAGLAACAGGPAIGSPEPTSTASPSASPSPADPTAQPTTTDRPGRTAQPTGGEIEHPTGSTDVILRMEEGGGFVPMEFIVTQAPLFTLYGDGTFIIKPVEDPDLQPGFDQPQPRFLQGHLEEDAVQSLLEFALSQGRLAVAKERYENMMIADASTTIFTINAGGIDKSVSVYALSESHEPGRDAVDRAAFHQLAELLRSFENRARAGELGEVVLYEPSHYRVTLLESFGEPAREPIEWPWDDITPDDFAPTDEMTLPIAILAAEEVAELFEVPSGGHAGIPVEYEDTVWNVGIRPLLPDEVPAG